jgi:ABC-2 type transport system permease protein
MRLRLFLSFARQAFHSTAVYRFEFWLRLVNNFVWMFSAYWLWRVLYTQNAGAFGISMEQMITYALVSSVISIALRPTNSVAYIISDKVKSGEIVMDILKPLDFHMHTLARNVGETMFSTVLLGIPTLLIAYLFLGMRLPASLGNGVLFLASVILGYGVLFSLSYLIGMMAVFTIQINNIWWAYNAIVRFFSGSEIPLWLFPVILRQAADLLPFKCAYAIPLSIYIGNLEPAEMARGVALQVFWVAGLAIAGRLLWRMAYRRLTVQGG